MASHSPGDGRRISVPRAPTAPPAVGVLLFDRYRLEDRLGVGGMAEVWRAHDVQLDRQVALKLLHRHLLPDARSRERFAAEARATAGLTHPGIVAVHDILVDDDQAAIVMELVDGQRLSDLLEERGRLPEVAAAGITAQIAYALQAAHDRGFIHRDVKPANVMVSSDGRARLVDFGIARALDDGDANLTLPGTIMGTLRYMAPEQLADGAADRSTDVFGIGSLLYEMLVGRPPFPAATPAALMAQQRQGSPQMLNSSQELAGMARAALQHDPERRPRGAGRMAALIDRWLANRGISPADLPAVTSAVLDGRPIPTPPPLAVAAAAIARTSSDAAPTPHSADLKSDPAQPVAAPPKRSRRSRTKRAAGPAQTQLSLPAEPADLNTAAGPMAGVPDPSVVAAIALQGEPVAPPPAAVRDESVPVSLGPSAALSVASSTALSEPAPVDPSAVTAVRPAVLAPLRFGRQRVPVVTAVGLAGVLLVGLLLMGAWTGLQAGSGAPAPTAAASHPVAAPPTTSASPTASASPTVRPAATRAPATASPVQVTGPGRGKPGKEKPGKGPKGGR